MMARDTLRIVGRRIGAMTVLIHHTPHPGPLPACVAEASIRWLLDSTPARRRPVAGGGRVAVAGAVSAVAARCAAREHRLPLPEGEGWGEGEGRVQSRLRERAPTSTHALIQRQ